MRASRAACAGLTAGWAAVMLAVLLFASGWVRGAIGDVAVVGFLANGLGALFARGRLGPAWTRALVCFLFAAGIEAFQTLGWIGPEHPRWLQVAVGRTADPLDVLAYAVGALAAILAERALRTGPPGS